MTSSSSVKTSAGRPTVSALGDKAVRPTARALQAALGRAAPLWSALTAALQAEHGPLIEEWRFSSQAAGWSCRIKRDTRVIVYMTPCRGHFLASFALGEKACAAAAAARLPSSVLDAIARAPRYAEGRGVRIDVRTRNDAAGIERLAAIKLAN